MKKQIIYIPILPAILILLSSGCTSQFSKLPTTRAQGALNPTATYTTVFIGTPTPTPYPPVTSPIPTDTETPFPTGIFCSTQIWRDYAIVELSVNNAIDPTVAVTLFTPDGYVLLHQTNCPTTNFAFYNCATGSFNYQPGGTYSIYIQTSIGSASATQTAPGGNISVASDGLSASWNIEGNRDYLFVWPSTPCCSYGTQSSYLDITSPASIPTSTYSYPGTYRVYTAVRNITVNFPGAAPSSTFEILDFLDLNIEK